MIAIRVVKSIEKLPIFKGARIPEKGATREAVILYIQAVKEADEPILKNTRIKRIERTNSINVTTMFRNVRSVANISFDY